MHCVVAFVRSVLNGDESLPGQNVGQVTSSAVEHDGCPRTSRTYSASSLDTVLLLCHCLHCTLVSSRVLEVATRLRPVSTALDIGQAPQLVSSPKAAVQNLLGCLNMLPLWAGCEKWLPNGIIRGVMCK